MKKHTIYRFDHMPANFDKLALAVWRYFEGSHNLLEVDGKLVFTDISEDEIRSNDRDLDTLIKTADWNEFDSLRSFEIWCLKVFAEFFERHVKAIETGCDEDDNYNQLLFHIGNRPAR